MGWEIYPQGYLTYAHDTQNCPPVYITENGVAFYESPADNGIVQDKNRISFFTGLSLLPAQSHCRGSDVRGYFVLVFGG